MKEDVSLNIANISTVNLDVIDALTLKSLILKIRCGVWPWWCDVKQTRGFGIVMF